MRYKSLRFVVPFIIAGVLTGCGIKNLPNEVAQGAGAVGDDTAASMNEDDSSKESLESETTSSDEMSESLETIAEEMTAEGAEDTAENTEAEAPLDSDVEEPEQDDAAEADSKDESADSNSGGTIYDEYIDIVNNYKNEEWEIKFDKFALINLDDDEIPELFATGEYVDDSIMGGMQPYLIVGHNESGAVVNDIMADGVAGAGGYRGTLYYLPGLGKLHDSAVYAPFGAPSDTIYLMKDGKIDPLVYGDFEVDVEKLPENMGENDDILNYGQWYWDGVPMDEAEYKKQFVAAIENTHGVAVCDIDYMSKDEIIKLLEEQE